MEQGGRAYPQGEELDTALIEFGEHGLGGGLLVHNQHVGFLPLTFFQWSQKAMTSRFWVALVRSALV
ncbi:MAG: hypothetical protein ABI264_05330 [Pseudonocardiaceae bacterium]